MDDIIEGKLEEVQYFHPDTYLGKPLTLYFPRRPSNEVLDAYKNKIKPQLEINTLEIDPRNINVHPAMKDTAEAFAATSRAFGGRFEPNKPNFMLESVYPVLYYATDFRTDTAWGTKQIYRTVRLKKSGEIMRVGLEVQTIGRKQKGIRTDIKNVEYNPEETSLLKKAFGYDILINPEPRGKALTPTEKIPELTDLGKNP